METQVYEDIMKTIKEHNGLTRNCLALLIEKFPKVSENTLQSILSLKYQRLMRYYYDKSMSTANRIYTLYKKAVTTHERSGIILRIATDYKISPCLAAKLILFKKYEDRYDDESSLQATISQYLKDTCLIDDKVLAYEIFLCTIYDDQYSPVVEIMKTKLTELGLAFRDEEWLRKLGYDKTPDFKLDIPIMIDGFVVHWIESKALFGDWETHHEYIKGQYSSYWNRFGPGLVIYWFGYLKSIVEMPQKNLMIKDHIPASIQELE